MKQYMAVFLALLAGVAMAQVPAVLLEACNTLEPAAKRLECLRAANQNAALGAPIAAPQSANTYNVAPAPSANYSAPSGKTCYTGPRGGTYTITKSGKKNYGGC